MKSWNFPFRTIYWEGKKLFSISSVLINFVFCCEFYPDNRILPSNLLPTLPSLIYFENILIWKPNKKSFIRNCHYWLVGKWVENIYNLCDWKSSVREELNEFRAIMNKQNIWEIRLLWSFIRHFYKNFFSHDKTIWTIDNLLRLTISKCCIELYWAISSHNLIKHKSWSWTFCSWFFSFWSQYEWRPYLFWIFFTNSISLSTLFGILFHSISLFRLF